jgi:hypothetical protein
MSDFVARIEHLAQLLRVPTNVVPRSANQHSGGQLNPHQEQQIRSILPDYAEFIVPVFWSNNEFVGIPLDSNSSDVELIAIGEQMISQSASNQQFLRYLRSVVSGIALQTPGLRRQGYFVIGRKGISIVGAVSNFVPELTQSDLNVFRDPEHRQELLYWQMPPDECGMDVVVHIPYSDLGDIEALELCRFDGLAAFISACSWGSRVQPEGIFPNLYKKLIKRHEKIFFQNRKKNGFAGEHLVYRESVESMISLQNEDPFSVGQYFHEKFDYLLGYFTERGLSLASGTGLAESGRRQCLLNAAIGVVVRDSRNGLKYFIESPFSELDLALSILPNAMNGVNEIPEPQTQHVSQSAPDTSFAAEVRKLNELRAEGLLTDEEFAAAKSALLRKLER